MEYTINLDNQQLISIEALKSLPYLTKIYFALTIDCNLEQKLFKINQLIEFLSENPTIKTKLKILSIKQNPLKEYKVATVGGTFDRFHIGHQILLLYAALSTSETLHIGITADWLLTHKKYNQVIQKMVVRMNNVTEFVKTLNPTLQIVAYQLKDLVGTNTTQKRIQCVFFSPQPGDNLIEINTQRVKNGLSELEVVRCPLLSPIQREDEKFSSTYIRKQLLDKNQMSLDELELYRRNFEDLVQKLSKIKGQAKINLKLSQIWWDQLYFAYSQRWRFYYTNRHIYQLLKLWNSSLYQHQREGLSLEQKTSLQLALFFHKIVYRPGDANNTNQSAFVCQSFIKEYLGDYSSQYQVITEAKRLIKQTESHKKPQHLLQQIFYDLEMRVFNSPTQYKLYAKSIMKEHDQKYFQTFSKKRIEELSKILKKGMHFSFTTEHVQSNVSWEIQTLQQFRK